MKPFTLFFFALVLVGCSTQSKVLNPLEASSKSSLSAQESSTRLGPQKSDSGSECARVINMYQNRLEALNHAINQLLAVENKTEQDIAALQILLQKLQELQIESSEAITEACG